MTPDQFVVLVAMHPEFLLVYPSVRFSLLGEHCFDLTMNETGVDNISRALRAQREGRIHEHWLDLLAKYDPMGGDTVEQRVMGRRMIFTSNPENIKAMMATKFSDFGRGPIFRKTWSDFLGLSIFTADGRDWHHFRQLLRPQFIQERVSDLDRFERHARLLIDSFGVDEKPIDLQWYFARYANAITIRLLFLTIPSQVHTRCSNGISIRKIGWKPEQWSKRVRHGF